MNQYSFGGFMEALRVSLSDEGADFRLHNVWFDSAKQVGAVEYCFDSEGADECGIAIAEIADDEVLHWREYGGPRGLTLGDFVGASGGGSENQSSLAG